VARNPSGISETSETARGQEVGVTELLRRARSGHREAEDELLAQIYAELRSIAHRQVRRRAQAPTAPATALAHEVYERLVRAGEQEWPDRRSFFAAYTRALHNHLVDRIRRRAARGLHASLSEHAEAEHDPAALEELVALREHLERLERQQPRAAEVLRLHHFAGRTIPEIAVLLGRGHATIERDLRFARSWLHRKMKPPPGG
jgi:RNA polymerase sigma factor (TIGR02999 family)